MKREAPPIGGDPDFLNGTEVAAYLKIDTGTLWRWRRLGIAPIGYKVGREWRYKRADLEKFLAERRAS